MTLPEAVYRTMWLAHLSSAEWHPIYGVEKLWMQDGNWQKLGAVTSKAEHRVGKEVWRTFVGGVIYWHDDTGGKVIA